jgi:hypothetical protein
MGFKKVGDWTNARRVVNSLRYHVEAANIEALGRLALKAEAVAKEHISNQDLPWAKLSPKYLAKKIRKGQSENILVADSTYFQSITSYTRGRAAYAGVPSNASNTEGKNLGKIAAYLELGSPARKLPARSLWLPTFNETVVWGRTNLKISDIVKERLKSGRSKYVTFE